MEESDDPPLRRDCVYDMLLDFLSESYYYAECYLLFYLSTFK